MNRQGNDTFFPSYSPPDFQESEQLKVFLKLKNMREEVDSLSLLHYSF